jgi:hypothetical protein
LVARGYPQEELIKEGPIFHCNALAWKVWKERNGTAFRNHSSTAAMIINKIEEEAMLWSSSSAIAVSNIIPRE